MTEIKRLHTLKTIAEVLNEGVELEAMLQQVLEELLQITGLQTGWIFLIDEQGSYELKAEINLPPALLYEEKRPMCCGDCWCLERYRDGRLENATNIIECKRLEDAIHYRWGETAEITHHATVPLRAGNEKFGILNVASPNKIHFKEEDLALLEAVAYQIGTAIKRLKMMEHEQQRIVLEERNRLARDLHDAVNQLLFSLVLTARGTKEMTSDLQIREMLEYMQNLSQEALQAMRALIWQLRPHELENGLCCALINYGKVLGLDVKVMDESRFPMSVSVEEGLWRIGQEALNNCRRHAGNYEVQIVIRESEQMLIMEIQDKGKGFNPEHRMRVNTLGLASMQERAAALGGTFILRSKEGEGTWIQIKLPLHVASKEG